MSGVLGPEEEINRAVEAVSFDNTLGILQEVVGEGLKEDRTIPVCSEEMYEVIADSVEGSSRIRRPGPTRSTRLWTGR